MTIDFEDKPDVSYKPNQFASKEFAAVASEIKKLLAKGIIKKSSHEVGEIVSPIFLREKPDGSHRLILNLKETNKFVENFHFKMETITTILNLVRQNCYMGSIDIKDAYYSVPVCEEDKKYLKFIFDGQLFQFTCLPNGLCSGPRKFTKLLKGPLASLREIGHVISEYIDDIFNLSMTYQECQPNIADTINLLDSLGFIIRPDKSKFIPSKEVTCLGYVINSERMTVKLTAGKKVKIKEACKSLTASKDHTIRYVAKVIGMLTASFPAVKYSKLHFRDLKNVNPKLLSITMGVMTR